MHLEKRGLVNWDWYFGERMETSSVCEKDKKRKDRQKFLQKLCVQWGLEYQTSSVFDGPWLFGSGPNHSKTELS